MTDPAAPWPSGAEIMASHERLRVILHEIAGHALTGRSLGYKVDQIVLVRHEGVGGWMTHCTRPDAREGDWWYHADMATIFLAGEVGELILPEALGSGYLRALDWEEVAAEEHLQRSIDLMPDQAAASDVRYLHERRREDTPNDAEHAERHLAAVGDMQGFLRNFVTQRAHSLVWANASLALKLVPPLWGIPRLDGDELEALIAEYEPKETP